MQDGLVTSLNAHRASLRQRWEKKLRALPPSSALAEPDALVHLMDWTLDRFFAELVHPPRRQPRASADSECPCGLNPLLAYFVTAEDALLELLFSEEVTWLALDPPMREQELLHARDAMQRVASREIGAFCALCRHREPRSAPLSEDNVCVPFVVPEEGR